jgi:hypothetical protein
MVDKTKYTIVGHYRLGGKHLIMPRDIRRTASRRPTAKALHLMLAASPLAPPALAASRICAASERLRGNGNDREVVSVASPRACSACSTAGSAAVERDAASEPLGTRSRHKDPMLSAGSVPRPEPRPCSPASVRAAGASPREMAPSVRKWTRMAAAQRVRCSCAYGTGHGRDQGARLGGSGSGRAQRNALAGRMHERRGHRRQRANTCASSGPSPGWCCSCAAPASAALRAARVADRVELT